MILVRLSRSSIATSLGANRIREDWAIGRRKLPVAAQTLFVSIISASTFRAPSSSSWNSKRQDRLYIDSSKAAWEDGQTSASLLLTVHRSLTDPRWSRR